MLFTGSRMKIWHICNIPVSLNELKSSWLHKMQDRVLKEQASSDQILMHFLWENPGELAACSVMEEKSIIPFFKGLYCQGYGLSSCNTVYAVKAEPPVRLKKYRCLWTMVLRNIVVQYLQSQEKQVTWY